MNVNQLYTLINAAAKETLGKSALAVKDTTSFVSLGQEILSTSTTTEKFYLALFDRIGKTFVESAKYGIPDRYVDVNVTEFGAGIRKIKFTGISSTTNTDYSNSTANQLNNFIGEQTVPQADNDLDLPENTMGISVKIFSKRGTWRREIVISPIQLQTAFLNESEMTMFIDGVFTEIENEFVIDKENTQNLAINTRMAMEVSANRHVKLVSEYNAINTGATVTSATALDTPKFLQFATRRLLGIMRDIQRMSTKFNSGNVPTFTNKENMILEMLGFANDSLAVYLEADTYNKEFVDLGKKSVVSYWQGFGTNDDSTEINITYTDLSQEPENQTVTVNKNNIIACIRDKRAVGVMYDKMRIRAWENPSNGKLNQWYNCDKGYFVDDDYNCIVFTLD